MPSPRTRHGLLCMLGGGVLLGTLGVPLEEADQHPLTAVWFRCAFGVLALSVVIAIRGEWATLLLRGRTCRYAIGGAVLMLLNWWLFFESIQRTSIAIATLVFHLQPFIVMALGSVLFREPVLRSQWLAAGFAVFGLSLVADVLPALVGLGGIDAEVAWGIVLCLCAATCYAVVIILAKLAQSTSPACSSGQSSSRGVSGPGPLVLAWWQCAVGSVCLAWWPSWQGLPVDAASWLWLAVLGVFNTGLAYVLLYAGVARLTAGRIAIMQFAYPLVAVVVDVGVYGRRLDAMQLAGLVVMLLALLFATGRSQSARTDRDR